jgi:uncharacterized protein YdeI (YjbR/CyaY-like superfamily)
MKPRFFATPDAFRAWLAKHHATAAVLEVGLYNADSGKRTMTWQDAVDVALCFGWIDGVRHSVDRDSYTVRFTPRKPGSRWSAVNVRRAKELQARGLMHEAGARAFARRDEREADRAREQRQTAALDADAERALRANAQAWAFYAAQPPYYRRVTAFWIASAKKPETREKRLRTLIDDSAQGLLVKPFRVRSTTATRSTSR